MGGGYGGGYGRGGPGEGYGVGASFANRYLGGGGPHVAPMFGTAGSAGYGATPIPGDTSTFGTSAGIGATPLPGATPALGASPAFGMSSTPAGSFGAARGPASSARSYAEDDTRSNRGRRSATPTDEDRSRAQQIAKQYLEGQKKPRSTCPAVNRILGNDNDDDDDYDDAADDDTNGDVGELSSEES